MENNKNTDLIKIISENEKKSRLRLLFWLLLCLGLGFAIFYFGHGYKNKTVQLEEQNDSIHNQNIALQKKDSIISVNKKEIVDSTKAILNKIPKNAKDTAAKAKILNQITRMEKKGYIIYIQWKGIKAQKASLNLQKALQANGYFVPGIEQAKVSFTKSRISFFHDEDMVEANKIFEQVKAIIKEIDPKFNVEQIKPRKAKMKAPFQQIEIWLNL